MRSVVQSRAYLNKSGTHKRGWGRGRPSPRLPHRISGWMQRIFREQLGSGSLKPLGFELSFIDHYPHEPGKL